MIERVTAVTFHRFLDTGKTAPALFSCLAADGTQQEYVVKLRGGMERPSGALCEIYASLLARHLGITVPSPAIAYLGQDLVELIRDFGCGSVRHRSKAIAYSEGWNFASRLLTNLATWPVDKQVPSGLKESAADIFAFDALIQNPDRGYQNPNLGTYGGESGPEIVVYDHESAFSFLLEIFPSNEPWRLDREHYLDDHVFVGQLKGARPSDGFMERLTGMSEAVLAEFSGAVPPEWRLDDLPRIEAHLRLIREHAIEFASEVERRLR